MSEYFMDPSLVLETDDDLRQAVLNDLKTVWSKKPHPFQFRVRSNYLVNLIGQLPRSPGGIIYNSEVRRQAIDRLALPNENCHADGTTLSLLVYNAQGFRRSDEYRQQGFVPFTQELIDQVGQAGKILAFCGTELTVRDVQGTFYAFEAKKRKHAAMPMGNPVKIIKVGKPKQFPDAP